MTSPRLAAFAVVTILVGILAVQYVRAVAPAVDRERWKRATALCAKVTPGPQPSNTALGRFPQLAPDFQAMDKDGKMWPLSAYRGRVVFLNFWATWCDTCREEMPSMERLQKLFGHEDFVVLAVASDDSWDKIRSYFTRPTTMTVLLDPPDADQTAAGAAMRYGTTKLPETYLIDRDGNIRYYFVSTRDWANPKAIACVKALLEE